MSDNPVTLTTDEVACLIIASDVLGRLCKAEKTNKFRKEIFALGLTAIAVAGIHTNPPASTKFYE